MKVLFSTMSVVEYDGRHYYNNPIKATYPRYLLLGEDMTVICFLKEVKTARQDMIEDGTLKLRFLKRINSIRTLFGDGRAYNEKLIEEEVKKADVCVLHMPCFHNYTLIKYAQKYRKPYLTVICACAWDEYWTYDWRGRIIAPYAWSKLKKAQSQAAYSIYVTQSFLQRRYPNNGCSIGCSNVNIQTGIDGVLNNRHKGIRDAFENKRILKIGTVAPFDVPYKGQATVIQALSILKNRGITFEYHLIGKGSKDRLYNLAKKKGVEDQVFFHNPVPHNEILHFYDDIDIYIHPSKTEGLPRALIEAMSRGCYCLGSIAGGIPELLDNKHLFKKNDIKEVADELNDISMQSFLEQSERNFNKAKEYDVDVLNERRRQFILYFKESINKQ